MLMMRQKPFEAVQVKKGSEDEMLEFVKKHLLVSALTESNALTINTVFNKIVISYDDYLAYAGDRFMVINKNDADKYYEVVK